MVRAARAHLAALAAIERAAAGRFPPEDLPRELVESVTPQGELEEAQRDGRLWVALGADGAPIGFALLGAIDGLPHLAEIDVHPDHAGRGIGKALLRAVFAAAHGRGARALTLTTFSHLPWNAPFYARMGFRILPAAELTPGLKAQLADEAAEGMDPARRVAMRRELP